MTVITRHLFVYGTLMSTATGELGRHERARLAAESRNLGPATMVAARLYDLGRYPGLAASRDLADAVHGEVRELLDPERTLRWLDAYEDVAPGDYNLSEYARTEHRVRLASGAEMAAWVYVLRREVVCRSPIAGGRWAPPQA